MVLRVKIHIDKHFMLKLCSGLDTLGLLGFYVNKLQKRALLKASSIEVLC